MYVAACRRRKTKRSSDCSDHLRTEYFPPRLSRQMNRKTAAWPPAGGAYSPVPHHAAYTRCIPAASSGNCAWTADRVRRSPARSALKSPPAAESCCRSEVPKDSGSRCEPRIRSGKGNLHLCQVGRCVRSVHPDRLKQPLRSLLPAGPHAPGASASVSAQ